MWHWKQYPFWTDIIKDFYICKRKLVNCSLYVQYQLLLLLLHASMLPYSLSLVFLVCFEKKSIVANNISYSCWDSLSFLLKGISINGVNIAKYVHILHWYFQFIDHTQWYVAWARKTFLGWIRVNDLCTKQCIYAHLKVDSSFILFIYTHSHFPLLRFSFFIANIVYEMYFLECNECSNQKWKESQMLNVFSWEFCICPI